MLSVDSRRDEEQREGRERGRESARELETLETLSP